MGSASQVGAHHVGVAHDVGRLALGQQAALVEHHDPGGQLVDDAQDVLENGGEGLRSQSDGWLNRALAAAGGGPGLKGLSI